MQLLVIIKRQENKILFYLAQHKYWVTYLKISRSQKSLQAKRFFSQNKPSWKWFMSIPMIAVKASVMENGWVMFEMFSKRIIFMLHLSVMHSKGYYRWDLERVETFLLLVRQIMLKISLLGLLELLLDTFCIPSTNKYACIGLDSKGLFLVVQ